MKIFYKFWSEDVHISVIEMLIILFIYPFTGYPEFGYWLNRTGKRMVYSCSWPVYQIYSGMTVSFIFRYSGILKNKKLKNCLQILMEAKILI